MPYTRIERGVREALGATGRQWSEHDVSKSDQSYWELIRELWADQETFCLVEHDIIVEPTCIDDLEGCAHEWCAFPFAYMGQPYPGLGCAKFSASLMRTYPDALERVGEMFDETHPPKHYCRLDGWLRQVLLLAGVQQHVHDSVVLQHVREDGLEPFPSHGCMRRSD